MDDATAQVTPMELTTRLHEEAMKTEGADTVYGEVTGVRLVDGRRRVHSVHTARLTLSRLHSSARLLFHRSINQPSQLKTRYSSSVKGCSMLKSSECVSRIDD